MIENVFLDVNFKVSSNSLIGVSLVIFNHSKTFKKELFAAAADKGTILTISFRKKDMNICTFVNSISVYFCLKIHIYLYCIK